MNRSGTPALDSLPDPLALPWPRRTRRCLLRPVRLDDADAVLAYRSDPEVTRYLSHDPLTRAQVLTRLTDRIEGCDPTPGRLVRGLAVVVDSDLVDGDLVGDDLVDGDLVGDDPVGGDLIGDAMLRVQRGPASGADAAPDSDELQLWIGYALRRDAWGRGLATEVARALVAVGAELNLPVWADADADNLASQAVLRHAGLVPVGETVHDSRRLIVFGQPPGVGDQT